MSTNSQPTLEPTLGTGNTKPVPNKTKFTSRNFILTIQESQFDYLEMILLYLRHLKNFNYILCGHHDGPKSPHYHIYVQYSKPTTITNTAIYNSHIEKCFGSAQKNIKYIKCEDAKHIKHNVKCTVYYEEGEPSEKGKGFTIQDIKEMDIDELYQLNYTHMKTIESEINKRVNRMSVNNWHKDNMKVIYIYGPSGIGKSTKAIEIIKEYGNDFDSIKFDGHFYHGVSDYNNKIALYDDFRPSDMKAAEFINLIDYNRHTLNIKGGSKLNNYELIIITSILSPHNIYNNMKEEAKKQWLRRMEIIKMGDDETNDESEF